MTMFLDEINSIHIELTNRCNAKCPMCMRTFNDKIKNDPQDISIDSFKEWFSPEFIAGLTKIKFCGNAGDPAIAKDCLKIHQYVIECNPNIQLLMNTNGGVRTEKFWSQLGDLYKNNEESFVTFHIDGLEDTIYRKGVVWSKIMKNAAAYNATKARSLWAFIPFFHNEHQKEEAEELSVKLGFTNFALKISARWNNRSKPHKSESGIIYPPTSSEFNIDGFQVFDDHPTCVALARKEMYIDSWGRLFPCCWVASKVESGKIEVNEDLSLYNNSINTIMNNNYYDHELKDSWSNRHKSSVCHEKCTGSKVHVWEVDGVKRPQKDMWHIG